MAGSRWPVVLLQATCHPLPATCYLPPANIMSATLYLYCDCPKEKLEFGRDFQSAIWQDCLGALAYHCGEAGEYNLWPAHDPDDDGRLDLDALQAWIECIFTRIAPHRNDLSKWHQIWKPRHDGWTSTRVAFRYKGRYWLAEAVWNYLTVQDMGEIEGDLIESHDLDLSDDACPLAEDMEITFEEDDEPYKYHISAEDFDQIFKNTHFTLEWGDLFSYFEKELQSIRDLAAHAVEKKEQVYGFYI